MDYRLAILTHGDHLADLETTAAAFADYVTPAPAGILLHVDSGSTSEAARVVRFAIPDVQIEVCSPLAARGFCRATQTAWDIAAHSGAGYVFWLEHDFEITRTLDLAPLATLLEDPKLAQMALMRDAVNAAEIAAGGLFESRPGEYTRIIQPELRDALGYAPGQGPIEQAAATWLEHGSYFTTNPSLMSSEFMRRNAWPSDVDAECEGHFGIRLLERGYRFGVWGEGDPWCRHIGHRDGWGY